MKKLKYSPSWGNWHVPCRGNQAHTVQGLISCPFGAHTPCECQLGTKTGAPSSCTSTSQPWRALWGYCQAQTWGNTHPLPTNHRASSQLLTQPSLKRQRNKQIPNHQQGSQRGNQYKPTGKCTNGHQNVCRLSPISKHHLEK